MDTLIGESSQTMANSVGSVTEESSQTGANSVDSVIEESSQTIESEEK